MESINRADLEMTVDGMIRSSLDMLRDLHIVHGKTVIDKLLDYKIAGSDITVANLINSLFSMVRPVIEVARKMYPQFFTILEWAQKVVVQLFGLTIG